MLDAEKRPTRRALPQILTGQTPQYDWENPREPSWHDYAACIDEDPDLFFPEKNQRATVRKAKQVCQGCLVRKQCLAEAVESGQEEGVWGGELFYRGEIR